jgi:hypothetical protein
MLTLSDASHREVVLITGVEGLPMELMEQLSEDLCVGQLVEVFQIAGQPRTIIIRLSDAKIFELSGGTPIERFP